MCTWNTGRRNFLIYCVLLIMLTVGLAGCKQQEKLLKFGIHYGKVSVSDIRGYDMVILEPSSYTHREIEQLTQSNARVIGYVSMGEVGPYRWYYPLLKDRGLLEKNPNWNAYYINLEDSVSRNILMNKAIPEIMAKGFEGLFLDTIDDVAPYTDRSHMQDEMLEMIEMLDRRYPDSYIIQNSGLFLFDSTKNHVDAFMLEDVASMYDFDNKEYEVVDDSTYNARVDMIQDYASRTSKPFLLVDYAVEDSLRQRIYRRLDTLSYPYFISNIELDTLTPAASVYP